MVVTELVGLKYDLGSVYCKGNSALQLSTVLEKIVRA